MALGECIILELTSLATIFNGSQCTGISSGANKELLVIGLDQPQVKGDRLPRGDAVPCCSPFTDGCCNYFVGFHATCWLSGQQKQDQAIGKGTPPECADSIYIDKCHPGALL